MYSIVSITTPSISISTLPAVILSVSTHTVLIISSDTAAAFQVVEAVVNLFVVLSIAPPPPNLKSSKQSSVELYTKLYMLFANSVSFLMLSPFNLTSLFPILFIFIYVRSVLVFATFTFTRVNPSLYPVTPVNDILI